MTKADGTIQALLTRCCWRKQDAKIFQNRQIPKQPHSFHPTLCQALLLNGAGAPRTRGGRAPTALAVAGDGVVRSFAFLPEIQSPRKAAGCCQ